MKGKANSSLLQKRLNRLMLVCLLPMIVMVSYLLFMINRFSVRYDVIVQRITEANAYNIEFKEDMDYDMYIIAANSERASELIDTNEPYELIADARAVFSGLFTSADTDYSMERLDRILKSLDTLEDRVDEIVEDAGVSGSYDLNMERLDLNIRVLTELIQDQIQEYIYYESTNLENLREGVRGDVTKAIMMGVVLTILVTLGAFATSRKIIKGITEPIQRLCSVAKQVGQGELSVRVEQENDDELETLTDDFNHMVEELGTLVEDIKEEQKNLRIAELKLLQEQINPHFLYNTLDAIVWLAESGMDDEVVSMVTSLSDFFRTTLNNGRDYISVKEEEQHIRSYLEIQQVRYRDILSYEIHIPEKLYSYQILKLTLQPLIENALYHGIKNKRGMGKIIISGEEKEGRLILKVWDNGIGMTDEQQDNLRKAVNQEILETPGKKKEPAPEHTNTPSNGNSGFGLANVNQRIRLNYGKKYGLSFTSSYGNWTEMVITLPCMLDAPGEAEPGVSNT